MSERSVLALLLAASLTTTTKLTAQTIVSADSCRAGRLTGRVSAGQAFRAQLSDDLLFQLDPESTDTTSQGWTIHVLSADSDGADYSMVATPPYRSANPRYVDTSYGVTAEAALSATRREFAFVASRSDYDVAWGALQVLLWPYGRSEAETDSASSALAGISAYPATFVILEGSALRSDSANPNGIIEWMSFAVDYCLPR